MKRFYCDCCGQELFFENFWCLGCGHTLGYLPELAVVSALEPAGQDRWRRLAPLAAGGLYRRCENYRQAQACNWMIPAESTEFFCQACRLNRTIPDLTQPNNALLWQRLETAKRRVVYSLLALGLPVLNKQDDPTHGLAFDFLADPNPAFAEPERITTGHTGGVITLNIAEADDVVREQRRLNMHERYRTVLGHFRHEIGHYYWERLVHGSGWLTPFRELFGDERDDYTQALERYYASGPAGHWPERFISGYASAHPWEDWAETWAHYLHMTDTLETAQAFGLTIAAAAAWLPPTATAPPPLDSFEMLVATWLPLTFAINSINRSMGLPDLYPFVLSAPVLAKLRFVHEVIAPV